MRRCWVKHRHAPCEAPDAQPDAQPCSARCSAEVRPDGPAGFSNGSDRSAKVSRVQPRAITFIILQGHPSLVMPDAPIASLRAEPG